MDIDIALDSDLAVHSLMRGRQLLRTLPMSPTCAVCGSREFPAATLSSTARYAFPAPPASACRLCWRKGCEGRCFACRVRQSAGTERVWLCLCCSDLPPPPVSTLSRAPSSPSTLSHYFPLIICGCLLSRPCPFVAAGSTAISACRRRPDSLLHRPGPAAIPCAGQGRGWLGGSGVHRCAAIAAATVPCQHPGVRRRCVQSHAL